MLAQEGLALRCDWGGRLPNTEKPSRGHVLDAPLKNLLLKTSNVATNSNSTRAGIE